MKLQGNPYVPILRITESYTKILIGKSKAKVPHSCKKINNIIRAINEKSSIKENFGTALFYCGDCLHKHSVKTIVVTNGVVSIHVNTQIYGVQNNYVLSRCDSSTASIRSSYIENRVFTDIWAKYYFVPTLEKILHNTTIIKKFETLRKIDKVMLVRSRSRRRLRVLMRQIKLRPKRIEKNRHLRDSEGNIINLPYGPPPDRVISNLHIRQQETKIYLQTES